MCEHSSLVAVTFFSRQLCGTECEELHISEEQAADNTYIAFFARGSVYVEYLLVFTDICLGNLLLPVD
jgi:hypothetical protein